MVCRSINLLLFVDTQLTGSHVHQQKQSTHNRQDLEEVVFGKVLVRVVVVQLQ